MDLVNEAAYLFGYTQSLRRDFHRHPELGFNEYRTAELVVKELKALGLDVIVGMGETGVVGVMEGKRPGPVVLMRFDMDALPILEENVVEYVSTNKGVMHACGHDGHVATGLSVAKFLHGHREKLAGTVKFIFQPAEEGLGGAEAMIQDGVLADPKPDYAFALHLWNEKPLGWLGITCGPIMAAADKLSVRVNGKGGHGASPHLAMDPLVATASIIASLQSIVARNVAPLQTAVISVTSIHGGDAFNVIPPVVNFQGTIRTFEVGIRNIVLERFQQVVNGVAQAMGCQAEIEIQMLTSAVVNNPQVTARVKQIATNTFPEFIVDDNYRSMVSEDMACILDRVPGCFLFVGSANEAKGLNASHHHPRFDFDEQALTHATALMTAIAFDYLIE